MKKILSGMFYRLFRGFELWVFLAVFIVGSFYIMYGLFDDKAFLGGVKDGGVYHIQTETQGEITISSDNIKEYRYEGLGISAYDAFRAETSVLPDDVYGKIMSKGYNYLFDEVQFLFYVFDNMTILPGMLMVIFIPVFFGRMFSDGTIKNLISCGHSKAKIYMTCLMLSFIMNFAMLVMNIIIFVVNCLIFSWKPPIYLPAVLVDIVIQLLIMLTITSVAVAAMFISSKKTAAFVAGFILSVAVIFPTSAIAISELEAKYERIDYGKPDTEEFEQCYRERNCLEQSFDLTKFRFDFYHDGRRLDIYHEPEISEAHKNTLITIIFTDPMMINHFYRYLYIPPYLIYRDGLMAVNVASNVIWTVLSASAGILIFRKKEIN